MMISIFMYQWNYFHIDTFIFIFIQREELKYSWLLSVTSEYHGDLDLVVGAHEEHHVRVLHAAGAGDPDTRVLGF